MKTKVSYEGFWKAVTNTGRYPCALAGAPCHRCSGSGFDPRRQSMCLRCDGGGVIRCSSVLDAHHFVPKRHLPTVAAKTDSRNGIALCRDHHDLVEQGYMLSPRPPLLAYFLTEHSVPDRLVPRARTAAPRLRLVRR